MFDWYVKCSVTQLEYVLCQKGQTFALVRILQHPDTDFMVVAGPVIANEEVVVPRMELDREHEKDRFERLVLRTLWVPNGRNFVSWIDPFVEYSAAQQTEEIIELLGM